MINRDGEIKRRDPEPKTAVVRVPPSGNDVENKLRIRGLRISFPEEVISEQFY